MPPAGYVGGPGAPPPIYGAGAPPPPLPPGGRAFAARDRLMGMVGELEMSAETVDMLYALEGYDIAFIADDSGSMASVCSDGSGTRRTRWDELQAILNRVVPIAACFDDDGIDLYFLNGGVHRNLRSVDDAVAAVRRSKPGGGTPLLRALQAVIRDKRGGDEKKLLVVVVTDGEPSDATPAEVKRWLQHNRRPDRVKLSFVACTDDESAVAWLNDLDDTLPGVDTCDDYHSERAEVRRASGGRRDLLRGDYVAKCLLGPISDRFDALDGSSAPGGGAGGRRSSRSGGCCVQ